jgi:hypothetical protein
MARVVSTPKLGKRRGSPDFPIRPGGMKTLNRWGRNEQQL